MKDGRLGTTSRNNVIALATENSVHRRRETRRGRLRLTCCDESVRRIVARLGLQVTQQERYSNFSVLKTKTLFANGTAVSNGEV